MIKPFSSEQFPIHLRYATAEDVGFIVNSWMKSYRHAPQVTHLSNALYHTRFKQVVVNILSRAQVIIACSPEDHFQIFGWTCFEQLPETGDQCWSQDGKHSGETGSNVVFHYVYVKSAYRKLGIATKMFFHLNPTWSIDNLLISHAPPTKVDYQRMRTTYPNIHFCPYLCGTAK